MAVVKQAFFNEMSFSMSSMMYLIVYIRPIRQCFHHQSPEHYVLFKDFIGILITGNERKSATSFCHQVAVMVSDMFCNFYLLKNFKIANNSATTEAREKISRYLASSEFQKIFDPCLTNFENYQIYFKKLATYFQ